jgi:ceramide glucosyltransferase
LCLKHYRFNLRAGAKDRESSPVSILKPLKGADNGLRENLKSIFQLDYPEYELIFSVADPADPAYELVRELITEHDQPKSLRLHNPRRGGCAGARLIVGDVEAGPNPKVNNLIRSYAAARHDLVLISDSNIRVDDAYLRRCARLMAPGVGVVTAAVTGQDPHGFGGRLEAMYLNTFCARWMVLSNRFGFPTVLGKSMLFRKSTAERFGGIRNLSRYLAEDYIAGMAMYHLGLECRLMNDPVPQIIGRIPFKAFWQRHVRWGRMRKNMQLFAWAGELLASPLGSGALLAAGLKLFTGTVAWSLIGIHLGLWFLADFALMLRLSTQVNAALPLYWLARELLFVPMWLHVLCGNTVLWRGNRFRLEAGGVIAARGESPDSESAGVVA